MTKVLIEVSGGCVQAVHTNVDQDQIEVVIWDWDNVEAGDEKSDTYYTDLAKLKKDETLSQGFERMLQETYNLQVA